MPAILWVSLVGVPLRRWVRSSHRPWRVGLRAHRWLWIRWVRGRRARARIRWRVPWVHWGTAEYTSSPAGRAPGRTERTGPGETARRAPHRPWSELSGAAPDVTAVPTAASASHLITLATRAGRGGRRHSAAPPPGPPAPGDRRPAPGAGEPALASGSPLGRGRLSEAPNGLPLRQSQRLGGRAMPGAPSPVRGAQG